MKGGTDYIMTNKFEILETPIVKEGDDVDARLSRWFRTHRKFTHPIQTMVRLNNNFSYTHRLWDSSVIGRRSITLAVA